METKSERRDVALSARARVEQLLPREQNAQGVEFMHHLEEEIPRRIDQRQVRE
jgi:hypothetical protein